MKLKTKGLQQRLPSPLRRYISRFDNPLAGFAFTVANRYYEADGCRFSYPKDRVGMGFRSLFFFDLFENEERRLIAEYLEPGDSVLELGACIGVIACITDKHLDGTGSHVVVEANPWLLPTLHENRRLNEAGFLIEACAVGGGDASEFSFGHSIVTGHVAQDEADGVEVTVVTRSLAELEEKHGGFDVLIMDIEGGEVELLSAPESDLSNYRLVILEQHPGAVGEEAVEGCREALREGGLQLAEAAGDVEVWVADR